MICIRPVDNQDDNDVVDTLIFAVEMVMDIVSLFNVVVVVGMTNDSFDLVIQVIVNVSIVAFSKSLSNDVIITQLRIYFYLYYACCAQKALSPFYLSLRKS